MGPGAERVKGFMPNTALFKNHDGCAWLAGAK